MTSTFVTGLQRAVIQLQAESENHTLGPATGWNANHFSFQVLSQNPASTPSSSRKITFTSVSTLYIGKVLLGTSYLACFIPQTVTDQDAQPVSFWTSASLPVARLQECNQELTAAFLSCWSHTVLPMCAFRMAGKKFLTTFTELTDLGCCGFL